MLRLGIEGDCAAPFDNSAMPSSAPVHPSDTPRTPAPPLQPDWDLFCRVIDNHGDLGVCWRLACDLAQRGLRVRIWIDDASALAWMAPGGHPGVEIRPWAEPDSTDIPAKIVVEAFGCDPPAAFIKRMAARTPAPVWINLEYLSAEPYVERSHGLRSPVWHGPGAGLEKWFFYPGFTPATGGLIREADALQPHLSLRDPMQPQKMLLFGYRQPALPAFLEALRAPMGDSTIGSEDERSAGTTLHVTPGWSRRAVEDWLGEPLRDGQRLVRDALTVFGQPHVAQPAFDDLLRTCDANLVRGEDSLVRALWAGRPFLWQLYPQDDGAHHEKLEAFLALYANTNTPAPVRAAFEVWNGLRTWHPDDWQTWLIPVNGSGATDAGAPPSLPAWSWQRSRDLAHQQADLVTALIAFARDKRANGP